MCDCVELPASRAEDASSTKQSKRIRQQLLENTDCALPHPYKATRDTSNRPSFGSSTSAMLNTREIVPIDVTPTRAARSTRTNSSSRPSTSHSRSVVASATPDPVILNMSRTIESLVNRIGSIEAQNALLLVRVAALEAAQREWGTREPQIASPQSRPSSSRRTSHPTTSLSHGGSPSYTSPYVHQQSNVPTAGPPMAANTPVPNPLGSSFFSPPAQIPPPPFQLASFSQSQWTDSPGSSTSVLGRRPRGASDSDSHMSGSSLSWQDEQVALASQGAPPSQRIRSTPSAEAHNVAHAFPQPYAQLQPQPFASSSAALGVIAHDASAYPYGQPSLPSADDPMYLSPDFSSNLSVGQHSDAPPLTGTSGTSGYATFAEAQQMLSIGSGAGMYYHQQSSESPPRSTGGG
ncbi:hypothetical protein EXIGLDRAFT_390684 [Exidia glandulosa HHB12029]|uniref:Uncharacterized protein n=1 Tax=Exidia glandulosa HHB12029 TaxID=1314781 RepID=A0A166B1T4_EXIGL|nr:hypothetical protein EXIGLDRAFT_390684 [Exidia glandulosa HHB12029]